jgi:tRNA dimethylallyltransferase
MVVAFGVGPLVIRVSKFLRHSTFALSSFMNGTFFLVGPTATGKSGLAADVAPEIGGEIINADAFQIYRGLDVLTAKPDAATLTKVPHHLFDTMSILEEMNAEKFRRLALQAVSEIHSRGKPAIVVGGSGLYIKALTHGLSVAPGSDLRTRTKLNKLTFDELRARLMKLDPESARKIDMKNRRRVTRALEICLLSGKPASQQRTNWSVPKGSGAATTRGVFVFRDREDLYQRINQRVQKMFDAGVIEEVRAAGAMSATASRMIGCREIRDLLEGKMSILQCIAQIQQATRRYAKRQLTWFRSQTNFEPLNLSVLSHVESIKRISQLAKAFGGCAGND